MYAIFKAAEICGCPPWEMVRQPSFWRDHALVIHAAENKAEVLRRNRMLKMKAK